MKKKQQEFLDTTNALQQGRGKGSEGESSKITERERERMNAVQAQENWKTGEKNEESIQL